MACEAPTLAQTLPRVEVRCTAIISGRMLARAILSSFNKQRKLQDAVEISAQLLSSHQFCAQREGCRTFSSFSSKGRPKNHYEVLGVSRTAKYPLRNGAAGVAEIKAAFREKAKKAHPDTARPGEPGVSVLDFASVLLAYQVLTDVKERQVYDLSIDPRTGEAVRESIRGYPGAEASSRRAWSGDDFSWVREGTWAAWAAAGPTPSKTDNPVDHLRANLRTDLRSALRHAYLGPELELASGQLPEAFEGEERSDPAADDLLQLVSGRQLLGAVRERKSKQLRGPEIAALEAGAGREDTSGAGESSKGSGATQRSVLELDIDGQLAAVGLREWLPARKQRTLFFNADGTCIAEEQEGNIYSHISQGSGGRAMGHEVVRASTPFVRHLHFVARNGGTRVSVCRCRRAVLPPSTWWLFPPRSDQHSSRSWHFQWPGHEMSDHPLWLSPPIFLLTAAFETLEDERRAAARLSGNGVLQKAASWARGVLGC